ncbi:hypothetical protein PFICI_12458 [Pestalotiopsis fici W106-1]|uniref:Uncharacterized protein n=1 Tax=Pestalotiopsis fici (strain W106-1 / CGMCC3.15140) TaxID=1229662 RepID=W3WNZ1_PESFW|nr:uncharacterized protein PFICI_12458 [Pestalotiopsis fici W106-1]ETS75514.1 hypothetical protein PFICI_12458 [Pestalotiopsis fici W106-1]
MDDEANRLAWSQTIASWLALLGVILAVAGLATERIRRVREHDESFQTTNPRRMGCFRQDPPSRYRSLLGGRTPALEVPSLEHLFEDADRGLWTSSTLDHMSAIQAELSWVPLYEAVFGEIVRFSREDKKDIAYYGTLLRPIFNNIQSARHELGHTTKFFQDRDMLLRREKLVNCVRELPEVDVGPDNRASAVEERFAKLQSIWIAGNKPCISVTREELVALALFTGMRIERSAHGLHYSGRGPFGLSIDLIHTDANWRLSLVRGSRIPRHAPSLGSGYTLLMAKHLACGSIPFQRSPSWVRSVYLRDDVLSAVKAGHLIIDVQSYGGPTLEFLRRLPADKAVDAFYGVSAQVIDVSGNRIAPGTIMTARGAEVGWSHVVAGIAFGGLVPQVHPNVIEAVKFTAAGTFVEACIQQIEGLVDALHRRQKEAPDQFDVFGQFVSDRCMRQGHSFVNYTHPSTENHPRDAAAIFARYMNLLEHVVALTGYSVDAVFEAAVANLDRVYQSRITATEQAVTDAHLGDIVANIKLTMESHIISLEQCGELVRCILAAWAATVPGILVKEHMPWLDQAQAIAGHTSSDGDNVNILVMDNLPPFVSFG